MALSVTQIAEVLSSLGCPPDRCAEMAAQLDKRAHQLAETKGRTYDEAVTHLLRLMAAGWAASSGSPPPEPSSRL